MKYLSIPAIFLFAGCQSSFPFQPVDQTQHTCAYYAYVDFGKAMTDGIVTKFEKVYRSSGLIKNEKYMDPNKNFQAVYTSYRQTKTAGCEIITIGPFDSESVANDELKSKIEELSEAGYVKKNSRHSMPAIILVNRKPCL